MILSIMIKLEHFGIGTLSKRTIWVGASKTITFLMFLFVNIFLARHLTKQDFGLYQQAWLFIHTLTPIFLLGIPQALNYYLPSSSSEKARQYISAFFIVIFLTGLSALGLSMFLPRILARIIGNPNLKSFIPILGLYVFFILPSYLLEPLLILKHRVRELFFWTLAFGLAFIGIILWFGSVHHIKDIFIGFVLIALFKALFVIGRTAGLYGPGKWVFTQVLRRPLINYLYILGGIASIDILSLHIDKYIVSHFLGPEKYALYAIGSIEIPFVIILTASVTAIIMPELTRSIAEKKHENVIQLIHRSIEKLSFLIFPIWLYLLITAGFYIPFLFGDAYRPSILIFYVYLCIIPIRALNNHPYLIAAGLQKYALYARIIDLLIDFLLGLVLIRWIGIIGPAVAMIAASYVHKIYQTIIVCRHLRLGFKKIYPWRSLGKILLATGICALVLKLSLTIFGENVPSIVMGTILFCGLYLLIFSRIIERNHPGKG